MRILSQNRQQVVVFDSAFAFKIEPREGTIMSQIVAVSPEGAKAILGIYYPKEATKILDELCKTNQSFFEMPLSLRYSAGRVLSEKDLSLIYDNFSISKHAAQRMEERGLIDAAEKKDVPALYKKVKEYLKAPVLAFWNEDGTASLCVDATHYFVVQYIAVKKKYVVLTYNAESENGFNVFDKQKAAQSAVRGEKNEERGNG